MIITIAENKEAEGGGAWEIAIAAEDHDDLSKPPPDGGTVGLILLALAQKLLREHVAESRRRNEEGPKVVRVPAAALPVDFLKGLQRSPPSGPPVGP